MWIDRKWPAYALLYHQTKAPYQEGSVAWTIPRTVVKWLCRPVGWLVTAAGWLVVANSSSSYLTA